MPQLQDLRADAREGTHLSRLGDARSRLELFVPLNQAKVRREARRAVDRLRSRDLWDIASEIAFDAARDCLRRDYLGVADGDKLRLEDLPEDEGDYREWMQHAAEIALEAAGFDIEVAHEDIRSAVEHADECAVAALEVAVEGGGSEDYTMAQAFYGPPLRPPSVIVRRPVRSRSRASHGKPIKRHGSRRGAGCSTRGSPSDSDPDPDGDVADLGRTGAFSAARGGGWSI